MRLADYLAREGLTHEQFADRIKRSQPAVTRYVNGERFPDRDALVAIKAATQGDVTADDFLPAHEGVSP